ncbi:hypothetical protein ACROYT_G026807 [Oculina patagonica]
MWDNTYGYLPGYQPWDDSGAVRNLFLGAEGDKTKVPTHLSFNEWDCTALFQATIYARSFALPDSKGHYKTLSELYVKPHKLPDGKFHVAVVSPGGNNAETFALAIDQLRILRNALCHSTSSEIDKVTFDQRVQHAKDAFKALGVKTELIDAVLTASDFPTERCRALEECIRKELQRENQFLKGEVKGGLLEVTSHIAQLQDGLERTEKERKDELQILKNQLQEELKEEIRSTIEKCKQSPEVHQEITERRGLRAKVSLPKSCLPPMVPHFTGRQKECEEIISHMTSESTRIVSIWGSPGFGKTSVAVAIGHYLQTQGLPVYFVSLRGLQSKADLTSKLFSFLRQSATIEQSSQRLSLDDELCNLLTGISGSFLLILFENGVPKVKEEITYLLEEILRRNERVKIAVTTETKKMIQSLQRKSRLDLSSKPGSFMMHTLIQSFTREKREHEMAETLLKSKARFYEFYVSLFEKLNNDFLKGHSMSAYIDFYEEKRRIIQFPG